MNKKEIEKIILMYEEATKNIIMLLEKNNIALSEFVNYCLNRYELEIVDNEDIEDFKDMGKLIHILMEFVYEDLPYSDLLIRVTSEGKIIEGYKDEYDLFSKYYENFIDVIQAHLNFGVLRVNETIKKLKETL